MSKLTTDQLLEAGFGRDSALLALGGGGVGDLAGFVAATLAIWSGLPRMAYIPRASSTAARAPAMGKKS